MTSEDLMLVGLAGAVVFLFMRQSQFACGVPGSGWIG